MNGNVGFCVDRAFGFALGIGGSGGFVREPTDNGISEGNSCGGEDRKSEGNGGLGK